MEDRYGGAYDDLLSPEGERQVKQLVSELKDRGIKQVFSSPLKRARQTAEGLANAVGCEVTVIDDLRERSQYGPLTGMVKADAKAQYPDLVGHEQILVYSDPVNDNLNQRYTKLGMTEGGLYRCFWEEV